jgi:four helix bundle protein
MTNFSNLPHEKLYAYQEARKLLLCVHEARIADAKLRDQALRAAKSICLNIAEGAGRASIADKARVYAIARGETCEVVSALEIAVLIGECGQDPARRGAIHAEAVYALLTGLIRRSA